MNNVVPTFPLLRLPKDAILNTLRIMAHLEIFGISILSEKTRSIVESMKLTATRFPVFVTASFDIFLYFPNNCRLYFQLYRVGENEPIQELETPETINIGYGNASVSWTNVMSVKQMLDHFQFIFHISIKILYFGPNCERFSLESVHRNVKNFQSICFPSENHDQHRRVLNSFQPAILDLLAGALDDRNVPRYISIQNFDFIRAHSVQITLDNLLVFNARSIQLSCDRLLSIKTLKQFLKLFAKGSNPRLEYLFLRFRQANFQAKELFQGLKYQDASSNIIRLFKVRGKKEPQKVTGGWDIWRFDGTQATLSANVTGGLVRLQLFVWHDHCVMN